MHSALQMLERQQRGKEVVCSPQVPPRSPSGVHGGQHRLPGPSRSLCGVLEGLMEPIVECLCSSV